MATDRGERKSFIEAITGKPRPSRVLDYEPLVVTFRCTDTTPDRYRRREGETMPISDPIGLWMVPGVGQWGHLGGIPGRMGPGLEWLMDEIPESALHPVEQALRKVDRLLADGPDAARHLEAQHELLKAQAAMVRRQWVGGR